MPRTGRLHILGGTYHIMGRGLERRRIFDNPADKEDFLLRLGGELERTQSQCLAWALMSNHYHLLIRVRMESLGGIMGRILSGYATQYNRRNRRVGYVFQDRFKSILCDADTYLLELIRYIHLNPYRSKIIKSISELDKYRWTGHPSLLGKSCQDWYNVQGVLNLFGHDLGPARTTYQQFIQDGALQKEKNLSGGGLVRSYGGWKTVENLRKEHIARIGDERVLGDSEFVERVLKDDDLRLDEKSKWQRQGWNLEKLCYHVCKYMNVHQSHLQQKGRSNKISDAKGLICYWGTQVLGISSTELAHFLEMSQPAVSKSSKRGADYCRRNGFEFIHIFE